MTIFEEGIENKIDGLRKKLSWQFRNKRHDASLRAQIMALSKMLHAFRTNDDENANLNPNVKCNWNFGPR